MSVIQKISNAYTIKRNMPVNYLAGELDFCRAEFSYRTNDVVLYRFNNVLVTKSGCIYEDYFKVVRESLKLPTAIQYAYLHLAKTLVTKKKVRLNDTENYIVAYGIFTDGHYHWLCDFLPRIIALGEQTKDYVLIVPGRKYNMTTGVEILNLLKLRFKDIIFINENEYFVCKQCFMISVPCISGRIDDVLMRKVKALIDTNIVGSSSSEKNNDLLYISREKSRYRHLLNEKELLPVLKDHGLTIINFEDYSFIDQVRLAATSKVMMGLHGAGLTNMIYMKPGSLVTEFRRNKIYHNQCYWHLADSLGLHYAYLFGEADSNKTIEGNGCNITLPKEQLLAHLNWLTQQNFL
jgi:capsular polysaccharide biosynthesis protein